MTSELVTWQDSAERPPPVSSLAVWAEDARQTHRVCQSLVHTPFVPQSLRATRTSRDELDSLIDERTVANMTAAILTGAELGLTQMASLRSIVVIQGTPSLTAVAMRGVVQAHGHEVWVESSSDTRAVVCGQRAGSAHVEKAVWTWDRATKLGLTSKDNWRKQPEAMLIARGTSQVCRQVAADALLGLPYSVEELRDETPERAVTARRQPVEQRALPEPDLAQPDTEPAAEPAAEPEPAPAPAAEPTLEPDPEPLTPKQLTALNTGLTTLGYTERLDKLAFLSDQLGRIITTSKELSKEEASALIDAIQRKEIPAATAADWTPEPPPDWQPAETSTP